MSDERASEIAARQLADEARARGRAVVRRRLARQGRLARLHATTTGESAGSGSASS